jgi:hypothetical protein
MHLTIPKIANKRSYVYKLGYLFPIEFRGELNFLNATAQLAKLPTFGIPARQYCFRGFGNGNVAVKSFWEKENPLDRKWYADTKKWHSEHTGVKFKFGHNHYHFVFKEEKLRMLALTVLS